MSRDLHSRSHRRMRAAVFIFLALAPGWILALEESPARYARAIRSFEDFARAQMKTDRAPGMTVGFMKDDFLWVRGFGFSDLENSVPATAESAYRLASITKTITAIAVLQLVEEGAIDMEAEVQRYVPYFPRKKWPVPVGLLLGHLGGISHYRDYRVEGRIREPKSTREALSVFENFPLVAKPGSRYNYSSYGFNLLGAVIEGASRTTYGDYIRENIFEPLGMLHSRMDDPSDLIPSRVRGYRLEEGEIKNSLYVDVSSRFAGGGTRSSVPDLLAYARGICEGKLLKKATWHRMFRSMSTDKGIFTGYGMGWNVNPWNGHFQVSHGGSQPETRTHLIIFPLEHFAIALASNMEGVNLAPYYSRLASLVLGENLQYRPYLADVRSQLIYNALFGIWSHGLSRFMWEAVPPSTTEVLEKAFKLFNTLTDPENESPIAGVAGKLEAGFHPAGEELFIQMGKHMASLLETQGDSSLQSYTGKGPLAFFEDYARLTRSSASAVAPAFRISPQVSALAARWNGEWSALAEPAPFLLHITTGSDMEVLERELRDRFSGKEIYPDFSGDIAAVARRFIGLGQPEEALKPLRLNTRFYGKSPSAWTELAQVHILLNNSSEARACYDRALVIDPKTVHASPAAFLRQIRELGEEQKAEEARTAASIALALHPENALLLEGVGDLYALLGEREKALTLYRKARTLLPKRKELKKKIAGLRKR
jgi:CubicO group peptidase (beta-lactamase class C family)